MSKKRNVLSRKQFHDLTVWMDNHRDEIVGKNLTVNELSASATKELGFYPNESSVRQVVKEILGWKDWPTRAHSPNNLEHPHNARLNKLEQQMGLVCDLLVELGRKGGDIHTNNCAKLLNALVKSFEHGEV